MTKEKRYRYTYVMELEGNGYSFYVGHTSKSREAIMREHLRGGRALTADNRPLKFIEWIPLGLVDSNVAFESVGKKALEYMNQFGYLEVRGGSFCLLSEQSHIRFLKSCVINDRQHKYNEVKNQLIISFPELKDYFDEWESFYKEFGVGGLGKGL